MLAFERKWLRGQTQECLAASGHGWRLDSAVHSRTSLKDARISLTSPRERGRQGVRLNRSVSHTVKNEGTMWENGEVQTH